MTSPDAVTTGLDPRLIPLMDPESERELVRRVRQGDPEAFDRIYEAWNRRLFAFLLRLTRRREVAEDLFEETWLRLVKGIAGLRDDSRFAPWLFTVARNVYLSHRRARLLDEERIGELSWLDPPVSRAPSPLEAAATSELQKRLERALSTLPLPYREAVLLVGVHGLTPAEAALVCGVTPEALRQRLSRGRALLGERLREMEGAGRPPAGRT
ncbi:MAG: RNA polymerase sigma factor [Deltaproteobacteria bacterium]|nr:RNA polymerase sigma factor [Deltaproteobacteria bacterium]